MALHSLPEGSGLQRGPLFHTPYSSASCTAFPPTELPEGALLISPFAPQWAQGLAEAGVAGDRASGAGLPTEGPANTRFLVVRAVGGAVPWS